MKKNKSTELKEKVQPQGVTKVGAMKAKKNEAKKSNVAKGKGATSNGSVSKEQKPKTLNEKASSVPVVDHADKINEKIPPAAINGSKKSKNKDKKKKINEISGKKEKEVKPKDQPEPQPDLKDKARIEKKMAKKLAQKLKKKQKKSQGNNDEKPTNTTATNNITTASVKKTVKVQKQKKESKISKEESHVKEIKEVKDNVDEKKKRKAEKREKQKQEKAERKAGASGKTSMDPALNAATVFVGNLPVNTKRVQVVRLFENYGPVNSIRFRTAGGRAIFKHKHRTEAGALNAYVVLKDAETAEQALSLNGTEFKSHHLRVTSADKNSHNRGNGENDAKRMIFVGNLKYSATEDKLREIFSSCGKIEYVRCLRDGEKGCKGVAYVCFAAPEAVGLSLELNGTILDERPIHVERYSQKKLGAKQARDAQQVTEKKSKTGAKKRLDDKKLKKGKQPLKKTSRDEGDSDKKKKSEFRGVKVESLKKKQKKKKVTSQMQKLAKKIAPKTS